MASTDEQHDQGASSPAEDATKSVESAPVRPADSVLPRFARAFPDDPELQALVRAFENGRYAHVRKHAPALAAGTDNPKVAEAARELRRRLDPDPLARNLLLAAIALLVVLAIWSFQHQP